jgi:hypothetical protein
MEIIRKQAVEVSTQVNSLLCRLTNKMIFNMTRINLHWLSTTKHVSRNQMEDREERNLLGNTDPKQNQ